MSTDEDEALQSWSHLAPSTFSKLASFSDCTTADRRAILEGWVAWLNSTGAADAATLTFRTRLTRVLEEFDRCQKGSVDQRRLESWLNEWLETAGEVGGPERDQDPTLSHPRRWHAHPSGNETED